MRVRGFYGCSVNVMNGDMMNRSRIMDCEGAKPDMCTTLPVSHA